MNTYFLEPHDPLLARDGRPFTAGGYARTLPFVLPSTLIGLVRTQVGSTGGSFNPDLIPQLLRLGMRGPLLCQEESQTLYFPAPRDAVVLKDEKDASKKHLFTLQPQEKTPKALLDNDRLGLLPLVLPGNPKGKPVSVPDFWNWNTYQQWLTGTLGEVPHKGIHGLNLEKDQRIHVSINSDTITAADGMLFGTSSLEFRLNIRSSLGLSFRTPATLASGAVPLGGERRLSLLRESAVTWPSCPPEVMQSIVETGRVRLFLLTPARFEQGWKPTWLLDNKAVQPELKAAAVGRPTVISGWNMKDNAPKDTRRLAPAGSVYYLQLKGDSTQRQAWVNNTWLTCISDKQQDQIDGLGLAALGIWADKKEQT